MAQGKTISQLTGTTKVNQQDLFLIYQTGSTLNVAVSALTQNIVNTNFTGGTMMVTGLTTSSSISATTYLNLPYGNGTVNYVPKWTGSTGLGNSTIFDNGSVVAVGYNDLLVNFTVSANTFNIGKGGSTSSRALFMGKSIPSTWIGSSSCGQFDFNNPEGDQGIVFRTNAGYVGTGSTPVAGGIISVQGNARGLIFAGNPTEENHLVIDRFGKVGVGTNIPVSKFDVSVTADTIGVRISGNSSSDMLRVTQTGSGNAFVVEDSSNPDEDSFIITSGGTVGIGTSSPNPFTLNQADGKLHVRSGSSGVTGGTGGGTVVIEASTTNYLQMYSPDENVSGIVFGSNSDAFGAYMRWGHDQGKLQISTANDNDYIELGADNSSFKAYVTNNGFGVNTLPSQALHISGNTLIDGDIIYPSPSTPPVSSGSTGTKGTITWDSNYIYICVNTNAWKRSQLSSW